MNIKIDSLQKNDKEGSKLAGVARIILNDSLVIENVKIINNENKLFVKMPSVKSTDDTYIDIAYPTIESVRENIENTILNCYRYSIYEDGLVEKFYITDVKVERIEIPNSKVKAIASIVLNNKFAINRIAVIDKGEREDGSLDISLGFQKVLRGKTPIHLVSVIQRNLSEEILHEVFEEYRKI